MYADPSMDLVMQSHLSIDLILASRQLHTVHAEVGSMESRLLDILGVHRA